MIARLPAVLFIVVLLLAGVLVYQAVAPVAPVAEPPDLVTRPVVPVIKPPVFAAPPLQQFADLNARAPFDPARRPVAEASTTAGPATAASPQVTLIGVVLGGTNAVALLLKPNGQTMSVHAGQSVDGWQVARIERGSVVFRAGATDYTVTLRAAAGLAQPPLNNGSPPPSTEKPGQ